MGLEPVIVDYCAFGRDEKKPTHLWTNDFALRGNLGRFRCNPLCQVDGNHLPVQQSSHLYDFGAIPQALAEEVAEHVHSKFNLDGIRLRKAAPPDG
jgi:hypothetical protein